MKKIEDYLHLYLGCQCEIDSRVSSTERSGVLTDINNSGVRLRGAFGGGHLSFGLVKPILRPLSDITEEETKEAAEFIGVYGDMPGRRTYKVYKNVYGEMVVSWGTTIREKHCFEQQKYFSPELFHYLLSKHFDLFGLIDAGLAIDATIK